MTQKIIFQNRTIVVADSVLAETLQLAARAAQPTVPVFLCGESGTGKELIARYIHERSSCHRGPFVSVNCAAIPEGLLEAELFGFEKGSFTGAISQKLGKFERATHGTLLLDEISEMPLVLQAKLLRVLQEGEIDRIGGNRTIPISTRILATTNRDPAKLVMEGKFRKDLYYRLNVLQIECVPLRGRSEAIRTFAGTFLEAACAAHSKRAVALSDEATLRLIEYSWPGNIRELQNCIERAVLLCDGNELLAKHLVALDQSVECTMLTESLKLEDVERTHILQVLQKTAGNRTEAARQLGISVRTLRNKLKQYTPV